MAINYSNNEIAQAAGTDSFYSFDKTRHSLFPPASNAPGQSSIFDTAYNERVYQVTSLGEKHYVDKQANPILKTNDSFENRKHKMKSVRSPPPMPIIGETDSQTSLQRVRLNQSSKMLVVDQLKARNQSKQSLSSIPRHDSNSYLQKSASALASDMINSRPELRALLKHDSVVSVSEKPELKEI